MSEVITLSAELRTQSGTGPARELRRKGLVPAVIYGAGREPLSIAVAEKEMTKYYRKPLFLSQIFEFDVAGKKYKVLPKSVDLHPITEIVRHVDFMFLEEKEQRLYIPIVYTNKETSIGIKRGGYFNTAKRSLHITCPVKNLPRSINIDVANTPVGASIKAKDAPLPEGAKLLDNPEFVIASIIGKKGKSEVETEAQEE